MDKPGVAVAAVIKDTKGRVLCGRRKGGSTDGQWHFPSGKVEFGETIRAAIIREVLEETGIDISDAKIYTHINQEYIRGDQHWITFYYIIYVVAEIARVMEPDKVYEWEFLTIEELYKKDSIFGPVDSWLWAVRKEAEYEG